MKYASEDLLTFFSFQIVQGSSVHLALLLSLIILSCPVITTLSFRSPAFVHMATARTLVIPSTYFSRSRDPKRCLTYTPYFRICATIH
jgi:hypothetical protein